MDPKSISSLAACAEIVIFVDYFGCSDYSGVVFKWVHIRVEKESFGGI